MNETPKEHMQNAYIDQGERVCASDPLTWKVKLRYAYYGTKHWLGMKWHAVYWRTLHVLGIGWAYSRLICKLNWYRKFPDGRCMYCGNKH